MERATWTLSIAVGWLAACHPAATTLATPAAPTSRAARPPALAPELKMLSFYVGEWQCRGVSTEESGARHEYPNLRVTVAPVLDGTWLEVRVFEGATAATSELKGYDRQAHRYRHVWASGEGQSGSYTSTGWDGDHMVFEADHPPPGRRERAIFTRLSDRRYSHRAEIDTGSGYRVEFEKTCSKRL